ncbi:MAG TPA: segregation/condensation protein A [Longimicrobiales bacterium]
MDNQVVEGVFMVELDRFQGPLDLLLHLIREQDIDIFDIPIAKITQQFLSLIEGVEELGLDRAGEFLEMAATLVRIKAQMLLPRPSGMEGELEDPRAELVRRLLEYEHFREVARRLEDGEAERVRHFGRGYVPPRTQPRAEVVALELTWEELWAAALLIGERTRTPMDHHVAARAVPLEDKLQLIRQTLARVPRVTLRKLVAPFGDRLHAVVTFMAGLELSRRRGTSLRQQAPFTELWFYRRDARAETGAGEPGEASNGAAGANGAAGPAGASGAIDANGGGGAA